jgi:hypothetical protein
MVQRRGLRGLSVPGRSTIYPTSLGCRDHCTCPALVGGMIEQPANVVNKEGIELIRNLLLIGKVQRSFKRNP